MGQEIEVNSVLGVLGLRHLDKDQVRVSITIGSDPPEGVAGHLHFRADQRVTSETRHDLGVPAVERHIQNR